MTKKIVYSLAALAILTSFSACSGQSGKTTAQAPDIALNSTNTMPEPKVTISKSEVGTYEKVLFDASQSSDPDGDRLTYEWRDENGKLLSTEPAIDRLFTKEGTYNMTLYVTDEQGGVTPSPVSLKVTRGTSASTTNEPPVAKAKSLTPDNNTSTPVLDIMSGTTVHLTDDGSYDPDGSITKYEWRDMDGILLSTGKTLDRILVYRPEYDFNHDGTNRYVKTLWVTDNDGLVSSKSIEILVHQLPTNQPPVVDLGPDIHILANESATIHANASDPDGVIDKYVWKKAGVVVAEGIYMPNLTTPPLAVGTHTYTLTVTDNNGEETTDSIDIIVSVTGASGGS